MLLYELLTGQTPFDAKTLLAAGLDEMRRTIREEEPPRPSTRLSTLDAGRADDRRPSGVDAEPPKLIHLLRGRPGLDRDEVPGEGPHAALRDRQRLWQAMWSII